VSIRKLEAPEGYMYTNGETSGSIIYLGIYDSPSNWSLEYVGEDNPELNAEEAMDIILGGAV
jgi:hypothetical protein